MKALLLLTFISITIKLSGQLDPMLINATPTTDEEYNYLTKGYRIQLESGLDMKKGYYFKNTGEHQIGTYQFKIKNLIREAENELAGILIITYSTTSGITYYTGIPINNRKLMDRYSKDISKWHGPLMEAYSYLVSSYFSSYFYNLHKGDIKAN